MRERMKYLEDFMIWQKGVELAETIHTMTDGLSSEDTDGIVSTLRKTTFSVPAHLAEGFMKKNSKDTRDYFYGALSSLEKLENSLVLSEKMGYLSGNATEKIKTDISELNLMICKLIRVG